MNTEYPNLQALSQGCVSGRASEWWVLKAEAKAALEEIASLREKLLVGELLGTPESAQENDDGE